MNDAQLKAKLKSGQPGKFTVIPSHIAERCLNHKLRGVEGIYDRYDYMNERRKALAIIADQIAPLVEA